MENFSDLLFLWEKLYLALVPIPVALAGMGFQFRLHVRAVNGRAISWLALPSYVSI